MQDEIPPASKSASKSTAPALTKAGAPDASPIQQLLWIMDRLRTPVTGCPWDLQQTHKSLRTYCLEEAHEVVEAIDSGSPDRLRDELGDLLMQVVFHARVATEAGQFGFQDVARTIAEKLVRRHPHIFGDVIAKTAEDVLHNWEKIKLREGQKKSVIEGVPSRLPGLLRALRLQEKASIVGFDWKHVREVARKVREEVFEFLDAIERRSSDDLEDEMGDILFSLVNLGRFLKLNAEFCVQRANAKFTRRFQAIEAAAKAQGRSLAKMTLEEMDALWVAEKRVARRAVERKLRTPPASARRPKRAAARAPKGPARPSRTSRKGA